MIECEHISCPCMCCTCLPSSPVFDPTELVHRPKQQRKYGCRDRWGLPELLASAPPCRWTGIFILPVHSNSAQVKQSQREWGVDVAAGILWATKSWVSFFFFFLNQNILHYKWSHFFLQIRSVIFSKHTTQTYCTEFAYQEWTPRSAHTHKHTQLWWHKAFLRFNHHISTW